MGLAGVDGEEELRGCTWPGDQRFEAAMMAARAASWFFSFCSRRMTFLEHVARELQRRRVTLGPLLWRLLRRLRRLSAAASNQRLDVWRVIKARKELVQKKSAERQKRKTSANPQAGWSAARALVLRATSREEGKVSSKWRSWSKTKVAMLRCYCCWLVVQAAAQ